MKQSFERVGVIPNTTIEVIRLKDLGLVALDGWNGEKYLKCYQCDEQGVLSGEEDIVLSPVYKEVSQDQFEVVDYIQE